MSDSKSSSHPIWTNRWTYILATTGAAVGLGNIWKFPYIAGENGGGAFVLMYLLCILLLGLPILIAEVMLGRKGRANPVHAMLAQAKSAGVSKGWSFIGIMGVAAGIMILMYYSVVAGWSLEYVFQSATSSYMGKTPTDVAAGFGVFAQDTTRQLIWHTLFITVTACIVGLGVTRGIGNAVNILMPILFLLLLMLLWYAYKNGEFMRGLTFMFSADFSKLSSESLLTAMGHAFFTLSLGMGTIMVYGSYMPESQSIPGASVTVAFLDTLIALIAGMAIFPLVFASGLAPGSGPGLLFETLPIAFSDMWGGAFFGTGFFVLVSIAALSSSISLIEPGIAWLEKLGITRIAATVGLAFLCWIGGVASIFSSEVFDILDFITANIMLPLGGLLIAVFVGWRLGYTRVRKEVTGVNNGLFNIWFVILRFVTPIGVIVVFYESIKGLFGA
ncbi:MAG TPA: sodium-dependent transporter [Cellvibrionales bacterium]|nr:sodium-dependent transporter [Cellvibrionales bacterium]HAW14324.1 sodium-dependent transporter [Cellvibrionales bacterium]HCX27108.1 sodium-dependent transporter [Cellvibrionales bacterium]